MLRRALLPLATLLAACQSLNVELVDFEEGEFGQLTASVQVTAADGEPVSDLTDDSFTLYEDGQALSLFESQFQILEEDRPFQIDTLLLLDMSGSIRENGDVPQLVSAAQSFASAVLDQSSVGVAYFDGGPDIITLVDFSNDEEAVTEGIQGLETLGPHSAHLYAELHDFRRGVQKISGSNPSRWSTRSVTSVNPCTRRSSTASSVQMSTPATCWKSRKAHSVVGLEVAWSFMLGSFVAVAASPARMRA